MNEDPNLNQIVAHLQSVYACHSIIFYGSRARGDATETSDYDILGIRESGVITRDAPFWNGNYLDIFIYPESEILNPCERHLHMTGGLVLYEKNGMASSFLAQLTAMDLVAPQVR